MAPSFTGPLLRPADAGFDDAAVSRIFNHRRPSWRPAAVLRAAGAADVAAGVRLAADEGLRVAVRAGGHSWAAWSLREGTLLIDLAALTGMEYDGATGTVTVGPAVRGGMDLDPFLAARGRFFAGGHCPTVGVGGFLLQGGMGWNCRGWGWAAESIDAMQVVTASGDIVWCSQQENADLFWAARGSGPGFFGVVTAFRLRTRPRYRELTQTTYVYPPAVAADVLGWLHAARHDVPSSVELVAVGIAPPLPPEIGHTGPALVVDGVSFDGGPESLRGIRSTVRSMLGIATTPQPSGMSIWRVVADRPAEMDCAEVYYNGPRYKAGYSPISASQCYAYLLDVDGNLGDFGGQPPWQLMYERSEGYGGTWGTIRESIGADSNVSHTRIEWLLVERPWYRGRAIVIGDAAHACPPLIAQGAAMCAEDAVVLAEMVTGDLPLEQALPAFMARRMPRVELVVRNSMQLVRWEMGLEPHAEADVARTMSSTLGFLAAAEA